MSFDCLRYLAAVLEPHSRLRRLTDAVDDRRARLGDRSLDPLPISHSSPCVVQPLLHLPSTARPRLRPAARSAVELPRHVQPPSVRRVYYRAVAAIGVGMLGYAFMGKAHSNAFKKIAYITWPPPLEPRLVGIAGRNEEAVGEAARRYG